MHKYTVQQRGIRITVGLAKRSGKVRDVDTGYVGCTGINDSFIG